MGCVQLRVGARASAATQLCRVPRGWAALGRGAALSLWMGGQTRRFQCFHASISASQFPFLGVWWPGPASSFSDRRWAPTFARRPLASSDSPVGAKLRTDLSCKTEVHSRPQPVQGELGARQAMASPPTAARSLNSGATPAPRKAGSPARLGSDISQRAYGCAPGDERARGAGRCAHHAQERPPEEKSRRARSRAFASGRGHTPIFSHVQ